MTCAHLDRRPHLGLRALNGGFLRLLRVGEVDRLCLFRVGLVACPAIAAVIAIVVLPNLSLAAVLGFRLLAVPELAREHIQTAVTLPRATLPRRRHRAYSATACSMMTRRVRVRVRVS